jgi:hypothetical protein
MRGQSRRGAGRPAEENEQHGPQAAGAVAAGDRRTRRRLLAGVAGVLGVAAAEVVGNGAPAQAAQGGNVVLGTDNTGATARTGVMATAGESALLADPGTGIGVAGTGVSTGPGVSGTGGANAAGVFGTGGASGFIGVGGQGTGPSAGVHGTGGPTDGNGVEGYASGNGTGVVGTGSGTGTGVEGGGGPNGGTGVFGVGGGSGTGIGVYGNASGTGDAVYGLSQGGNGVHGVTNAASAVGVLAENPGGGAAFQAVGPAVFSRSGVLTIAAGKSSATQTGIALTAGSLVLATVQQNLSGVYVRAAVPKVSGSSFTVYLSKAVTTSDKVAWFIVN